ncbi:YraN family protein [Streptomyces phaeochromogenes]|uniref:YraN family protein n=1 Tax=Streptomyces phaeochromogenes TaxID=1923 RepID=UPI00369936E8
MKTSKARNALGKYGEDLAARRLTESGMTVLRRNWRSGRAGEIDIVARDGDALVVCEVKTRRKTRRTGTFEHPMAAVTPVKAQRLRGLAERWLQEHGGAPPGGVRIDVVGVLLPERGAPVVEHVRGVA